MRQFKFRVFKKETGIMYYPESKQEEQATEQQNAQESASQDQAMEVDSEEGGTEG
jgi:hypothetical protein